MSQQTMNAAVLIYPLLDGDVSSGANISASKIQQQRVERTNFDLDRGDTPVAADKTLFVATSAGTLKSFNVMLADTGTTTDIDFDLKINGVSALTAVVNITNSETDDTLYSGTITTSSVSAGDVVSVDITVTTSTGAQGPFCQLVWNESPVS